jgi:flagellar biosynthesis anti-sigma factor FlgM
MRINALGVVNTNLSQQISKDGVEKAPASTSSTARHQVASEDTTSFTSDTQTVQSLSQTALQTFPSRQVKVEALKQAVNSAQYQLDSAKVAQSLVSAED